LELGSDHGGGLFGGGDPDGFPRSSARKRAAKFIVVNTLLLIPISLLFYLYLAGTGQVVYLVGAAILDLLLLATNIKLLIAPTRANALSRSRRRVRSSLSYSSLRGVSVLL